MWSIAEMTAHVAASTKTHAVNWKIVCAIALGFHTVQPVRVAILAILGNLSPDSGNLTNFEDVWLHLFWFGDLATYFKVYGSKSFGLAKYTKISFLKVFSQNVLQCHFYVRPVYVHVFTYINMCRLLLLSLLLVSKFVTSNESVIVVKVGVWFLTLLIKYFCKMLKLIIWKYFQNVENLCALSINHAHYILPLIRWLYSTVAWYVIKSSHIPFPIHKEQFGYVSISMH